MDFPLIEMPRGAGAQERQMADLGATNRSRTLRRAPGVVNTPAGALNARARNPPLAQKGDAQYPSHPSPQNIAAGSPTAYGCAPGTGPAGAMTISPEDLRKQREESMNLSRPARIGIAALSLAALTSCAASTQLTSSWGDPAASGRGFKKVVVVGATP